MYNYYRDDWLIDRLAGTAAAAFGHTPCVDLPGGGQAVVTAALDQSHQSCGTAYVPSGEVIAPATDDRPFLYFEGGSIPALYLWTLAGILLISLISVRILGGPFRAMRPYADLFFMGAAFLLLETKNIATFALLGRSPRSGLTPAARTPVPGTSTTTAGPAPTAPVAPS